MSSNRMIFSLDIGSSKVVAMVGSVGAQVEVHGISSYYFTNSVKGNDFSCISNGKICDLELVGNIINQALNEARIDADCSVGMVVTNISGSQVGNLYSQNRLNLDNQSVTADVIHQLIDEARNRAIPKGYDLLDYEVQEYLIDGENYAINPVHLSARTIESNLNMFLGGSVQVANVKKVIRYSGFGLAKIAPSGVLAGMSVLNREEKELGCCLLDIGLGTTDIITYENGFIRYLDSLPIGGEHITRDIAHVLNISRNLAEDVKLNYGGCSYSSVLSKNSEGITITDHRGVTTTISRKLLVDVITERVKEIFSLVKTSLNKRSIYDIIGSGIVLTGGASSLPNIEELARQYFGMPVKIGVPSYGGGFADLITNPRYAVCLGGLYFANEYLTNEENQFNPSSSNIGLRLMMNKLKRVFS